MGRGLFVFSTLKYNETAEAGNVSACIDTRISPSEPGRMADRFWIHPIIGVTIMSKATGEDIDTGPKLAVFFKDGDDEPVLYKHLPLTTTLGEVRKANPFGPSTLWIDFHLPGASRIERIELFSTQEWRGATLCYDIAIDDIYSLRGGNESWNRLASTVEAVIWEWSERLKTAMSVDSFAVNWGGPNWKHVRADGSVTYYVDGDIGYLRFNREYKSRKDIDAITLYELSSRASVICDLTEKMLKEICTSPADLDLHERQVWG